MIPGATLFKECYSGPLQRQVFGVAELRPFALPRPDPLRVWEGSLRPSEDIMATTNIGMRQGNIRNRAYLSIGVTSGTGAGLCETPGRGAFRSIGAGLYRVLDMNFGEFQFHALR